MMVFVPALVGAAAASYLLVRYAESHLSLTGDLPGSRPQKIHTVPVPRVGGLAVMAGLLAAGLAGNLVGLASATFNWLMLAALLPAFLGGFAEDLTDRVGVTVRLLMTLVSAAIAFVWLEANLYRSDVSWLDAALRHWPVSFGATLLAVGGLAHAMNIIDGYHGLSAGVGVLVLVALALVGREVGDERLSSLAFGAAGAYLGFLLFNYPAGRLFQGDGGAYLLGTIIAILSAQLVGRHAEVSPWFPLVLVVYPVWETLFSILRRVTFHQAPIGAPDAQHLHSLIYACVMPRLFPGTDPGTLARRNAATALPLWTVQLVMVALAIGWRHSTPALMLQAYVFIALYCAAYVAVAMLDRRRLTASDSPRQRRS